MLQLDTKLTLDAKTIRASNLCDRFTSEELTQIGEECWEGYDQDEQSRARWLERNEAGMDLALQISKDKNFPWPGCANVAFPLVTIAAMQFHARAYPAIVNGDRIVKCAVSGQDPDGQLTARSERISQHMSWQLMYEDCPWEEQEDKAILNLSIVGTNFKKSYFNATLGHNVSDLVLAKDLVLNYWSKSVDDTPRKTHRIPKFRNEIYENVQREIWRDILEEAWYSEPPAPRVTTSSQARDERQGTHPSQPDDTTALIFLEQHISLDLDQDGYAEPYIVTLEEKSKCVVRIVVRFEDEKAIERVVSGPRKGNIIRIKATEYFTKKTFIPSPDGGIYDIGFGVFLGPLNEAVNSLVNMLLDAGVMQTTAGGFLGRGAKIRGGVQTHAPFEWKRVDSTGDDLRKSLVPLQVNAPSDVLYQLLSLLINYTSRVSGTTDITVGENPGQNTPAQTTQTMVEMGQKIYTAIFKRIWRSSKEEFRKLFNLNGAYMPLDAVGIGGATRMDYLSGDSAIQPVADPNITSDAQRLQQALTLRAMAKGTPGYNKDAVEIRVLQAMRVDGIPSIYTGANQLPPPVDPKLQIAQVKEAGAKERLQLQIQADSAEEAAKLMEEQRVNNATIVQLMADADAKSALAQTEAQYAQVAEINAQIAAAKHQNDVLTTQLDAILRAAELRSRHAIETRKLSKGVAA